MIRVNGWTNHMEKIGNKEYHVSVDSFLNEEARKNGNERRFRGTYEWGGSKK